MDDVAAMLNAVAGGLQQSFGTVFERVGQSLEQSAQMMQMMNAMMEAAMLQHLIVSCDVRAATDLTSPAPAAPFTLHLTIENRSQINIAEVSVGVRLGSGSVSAEAVDTGAATDADSETRVLEQGLEAKSIVELNFPLDQGMLGHEGTVLLRVRSPGTHAWLEKDVRFRIPLLKMARVDAVASVLPIHEGLVQVHSDRVPIHLLREALGISAFDALLTATAGYYRLCVPAGVLAADEIELALQIQQTTESASGVRVVVVADTDAETSQRRCRLVIEELEAL